MSSLVGIMRKSFYWAFVCKIRNFVFVFIIIFVLKMILVMQVFNLLEPYWWCCTHTKPIAKLRKKKICGIFENISENAYCS